MFKPAQLGGDFTLCSCLDPALDLPEVPDVSDDELAAMSEDEQKRIKKLRDEYATKLRNMRADGTWAAKDGEKLTLFRFRHVRGSMLTWWRGETQRRRLSQDEAFELIFRLALKSIENCSGLEIEFEKLDGQKLATRESLDHIYAIGADLGSPGLGRMIVCELGALVATRAVSGVPPLS